MSKRGPKTHPGTGELTPSTVLLDDITRRKAQALGENLSAALRNAVRMAYNEYQRTPDTPDMGPLMPPA